MQTSRWFLPSPDAPSQVNDPTKYRTTAYQARIGGGHCYEGERVLRSEVLEGSPLQFVFDEDLRVSSPRSL